MLPAAQGGADSQALSALEAFASAIARDPKATANQYFDMAVMPDLPEKPAYDADVARCITLMRQIGPNRFLLASDRTKVRIFAPIMRRFSVG